MVCTIAALEHVLSLAKNFNGFVYNWAQSDQSQEAIQSGFGGWLLCTDQLNYNRYRGTARYSVNYHPPVGRGLDINQLDVFGALRILYKDGVLQGHALECLSLDSGIIPRILICACASPVNMDEVDLSSQPYRGRSQVSGVCSTRTLDWYTGQNGFIRFIHLFGSHPPYT